MRSTSAHRSRFFGRAGAGGGGGGSGGMGIVASTCSISDFLSSLRRRLALGRHLRVPVVVRVVTRPAGDLRDLAPEQARHVVVEQEPAARAVVVDDIAKPGGAIRHRILRGGPRRV